MKHFFTTVTIIVITTSIAMAQFNLNQGLMAHYYFRGKSPNDTSGNGFHALRVDGNLTADRFGTFGEAVEVNGANHVIDLGDILDSVFTKSTGAQFSVSGWAKVDSILPISGNTIISKAGGGITNAYQWLVGYEPNNYPKIGIYTSKNATNFVEITGKQVTPKSWFHYVIVFDGTAADSNRVRFYIDNQRARDVFNSAGTIGTHTEETNQHIMLGAGHVVGDPSTLNNRTHASFGETRIYNRPLSLEEINALYNAGPVGIERNTIGATEKSIVVYPNPAGAGASLSISSSGVKAISMLDNTGKLIITKNSGDMHIFEVPVIAAGQYLLSIEMEDGSIQNKQVQIMP